MTACSKCGSDNRYPNGACRTCKKRSIARNANKPCVKCGATDRHSSGGCRPCLREAGRRYREKNPKWFGQYKAKNGKRIRENNARSRLRRLYGLELEDVERLIREQQSRCAICKEERDFGRGSLVIDHCHTTGKVRGLLCMQCNTGIGNFNDSPERLFGAISYLTRTK